MIFGWNAVMWSPVAGGAVDTRGSLPKVFFKSLYGEDVGGEFSVRCRRVSRVTRAPMRPATALISPVMDVMITTANGVPLSEFREDAGTCWGTGTCWRFGVGWVIGDAGGGAGLSEGSGTGTGVAGDFLLASASSSSAFLLYSSALFLLASAACWAASAACRASSAACAAASAACFNASSCVNPAARLTSSAACCADSACCAATVVNCTTSAALVSLSSCCFTCKGDVGTGSGVRAPMAIARITATVRSAIPPIMRMQLVVSHRWGCLIWVDCALRWFMGPNSSRQVTVR